MIGSDVLSSEQLAEFLFHHYSDTGAWLSAGNRERNRWRRVALAAIDWMQANSCG